MDEWRVRITCPHGETFSAPLRVLLKKGVPTVDPCDLARADMRALVAAGGQAAPVSRARAWWMTRRLARNIRPEDIIGG